MNIRTKSKLVRAARTVTIATSAAAAASMAASAAWGNVVGPYASDANTAMLYHLDEAPGSVNAAGSGGFINPAIAFSQSTANVAGTTSTAVLGAAGATGFGFGNFGNAATFSGNLLLGFDGNNSTTFEPDLNTNTTNTTSAADAIASTNFTDFNTGAFTLEAMVNIPTAFTNGTNHEIISYDSSNNTASQRGFQLRFNQSAGGVLQLEYNNIADAFGTILAPIPTTGPDAFATNTWFHLAMAYDGTAGPNSVRLYWTKVDDGNLQAHLLATGQQGDLTSAANANMLTFGNENRNTAGEALNALMDEIRISNRVRTSSEFLFAGLVANYWNNAGGGDWDVAGNWTAGVPNAAAASAYFGGGITPPAQDSTVTLAGTRTVGLVVFDSSTFKYTLADGGGGSLLLDGGGGNAGNIQTISGTPEISVPLNLGPAGGILQISANATLTLSGNVSGSSVMTKTGAGVLILAGSANTYTGATSVTDGTLRATDGVTLPTTSNLALNGGVLETSANFARAVGTGANQVQLPGGNSGFISSSPNIQVAIGSIATPTNLSWGSAVTFAPAALVLGGTTATNTVTFLNNINLNGGARTVQVNTGVATLSGNVTNSTGTSSLIKAGGGTLVLAGSANTYTGTTSVTGGVLRADVGVTLPTASNISLNGGILQTATSINRVLGTGSGQIQIPGGISGIGTNGSDINVTITNGGNPILWGGTANTFSPTQLLFNSVGSNNINFTTDPIDLNGANRVVQVNAGTVTFNGQVTGTTALLFQGTGTIVMTNSANSYSGGTGISDNAQNTPTIVRAAASNALGTGNISIASQGNQSSSRLQLINNITLPNSISFLGRRESQTNPQIENLSGNNELSGRLNVEVGGQNWFAQSDAGTLTLSGAAPAAAGVAVTITAATVSGAPRPISLQGAGDGVVSGVMSNGTTGNTLAAIKVGSGTWSLTNAGSTYTGPTSVGEGTLVATSIGNSLLTSSIGAASSAANNLVITGGTLKYTGGATSTDHLLTISAAGGTIDASGSGPLNFNNGGANVSSDPANRALALDFTYNTSTAVVQLPGVLDLLPGMTVTGTNIAPGTTILSVDKQNLRVTLSQNPTAAVNVDTLSFTTADRVLTLTGSGEGIMGNALTNSTGGAKLGVTKTGSGTWTLSNAANSYTGSTTVNNGRLRLAANLTTSGAVNVTGGTLEIVPNGTFLRMLRTPSVTITGGNIDIQDNKLITQTPAGSWNGSSYTGVTQLIASGRNGTAWNGVGIVTTQSNAQNSNYTSVGIAKASDVRPATATATELWAGQTITGTDTLVMYTYGGDATLDGKINIDDYVKIDSGIAGGYTGWVNGDFNYDGKVSIDDYITVIDANIGNQTGTFPTASGGPASAGLGGVSAVPEPGSLSAITMILAAVGALSRRRRRICR
jgi:autotransporter-associated beta strand protein